MSRTLLHAQATRDSFLEAVYGAGLVTAGPDIAAWTDKWFQHETLRKWNARAADFLPKTFLLHECPTSRLSDWIAAEFPGGFVAKPAVGHSSEGVGMIRDSASLVARRAEMAEENWLVQERVGLGFGQDTADEFRVHTFWHRVVPEATFSRWDVLWDDVLFIEFEDAVQRFLSLFPAEVLRGHA